MRRFLARSASRAGGRVEMEMLARFLQVALLSSLSNSLAAAQDLTGPVAISCKGTAESTYKGKVDRSWPTRTYVLDPSRKWVAYWNAEKEEQIPVCGSDWQSCSIKFGPRIIEAKGNLNRSYGFYMTIDRRSGFLDYRSSSSPDSKWEFAGHCDITQMPMSRTGENKF